MDQEKQTPAEDTLAAAWLGKIGKANTYYKDWSDKFDCDTLEEYFYGFQWRDGSAQGKYKRYVINFVFSTLEIKKPTLLFQNVLYRVKPKPRGVDFDFETSVRRCQLRENTLNTIIGDEDNEFDEEFEMFVVDAFFRFGIMEVDYSANWVENPKAGQPILRSDNSTMVDPDDPKNVIRQPEVLPVDERVYMKRIPAWRFRVGGIDGHNFKKCSWIGYYDFHRIQDLKANKEFSKALDGVEWAGSRSSDHPDASGTISQGDTDDEKFLKSGDYVKVWTIYDLRGKKKLLILENHSRVLLNKKYKELPIVALKFVNKLRGWFPVPLVFNWKSPQDEINEAREQQKTHRRRGNRKYLYRDGAFADDGEIDKLETGGDMTFAKVQQDPSTCMVPLQNAVMDNVTNDSMIVAKDDFNIISATSSENRGQADRTTATQANLIDQRSQLRENRARVQVANALKSIGRLILMTVQRKFTLPVWIQMTTVQTDENWLEQKEEAENAWQQITARSMGNEEDIDFSVDISLDSISPIENAASKQAYVDFLTLTAQFPQIAFSPTLVREAAYRCGYKNEKVIREMMKMAQIAAIGQQMQAEGMLKNMSGGGGPTPTNNVGDARAKQMQSPDLQTTNNQIQAQLPVQ